MIPVRLFGLFCPATVRALMQSSLSETLKPLEGVVLEHPIFLCLFVAIVKSCSTQRHRIKDEHHRNEISNRTFQLDNVRFKHNYQYVKLNCKVDTVKCVGFTLLILTSLLFIELLKVIKVGGVGHMLDVDGNGRWPISNMLPVSAPEETVILEVIYVVAKTILAVTHQSADKNNIAVS